MKTSPQPLRVLMTADTVGGVWTYALELCRALAAHGTQIALATMGDSPTDEQREEAATCPRLELFESVFRLEWMHEPWDDLGAAADWLLDLEERWKPDLIHLNSFAHGSLPWRAPVIVVGHSCVLSWWEAVRGEQAPPDWDDYRREVSLGLAGADLVIAPSSAMLAALARNYGATAPYLRIFNARNAAEFPPLAKEEFVFTAGRLWDEAKNVRALDEVAGRLRWPIYAAGSQTRPSGGDAEFDHLRLIGRQPPASVGRWLGRAAIYAAPARYEPFGLSVLEAALAGCALVLNDIPSFREIWTDAALYVDADDPATLRGALELLIEEKKIRTDLATLARQRALTFSPQKMGQEYLAAYQLARHLRGSKTTPMVCELSSFAIR